MKIFIDTNFFIGFFIESDYWHKRTVELLEEIKNYELVICNTVLNEIITLIGMKTNKKQASIVYNYLKDNYTIFNESTIVNINDKIMEIYLKNNTKLSFTDCSIIESMKELEIKKLVTFDKDFDRIKEIERIH
ncbi:MAG: type II toxin-antitoxin system VapC family toxin [Methanobacteriaceae archaeon]